MLGAAAIVSVSSCYAGMFEETGLLAGLKAKIRTFSDHTVPFAGILVTAIVTCAVSCNQTLSVMLTNQLCSEIVPDRQRFAVHLENSVIIIAALIPWNIACAVPLAALGAPASAVPFACYLWLLPLAELVRSFRKNQTNL
jgi:NhaC family Na+:H+ antiporter